MVDHNARLTSGEIANLWTSYQTNTMIICGVKYFLATVDDHDIRSLLQYVHEFTEKRLQTIKRLFLNEQYPIPIGFTDDDVMTAAPRLFSDSMILLYLLNMGRLEHTGQSVMYSLSAREDIDEFYAECLAQSKELTRRARKLALEKGVYTRSPYLPTPEHADFVTKQSFLTGWFGDRRPLLGIEISNLVYDAERNALGEALITGFAQVARSKEVRQYLLRGRDISAKHFEIFSSVLHTEQLSSSKNLTSEVTDSTVPPFSDKLIMVHIAGLVASGISQYGFSMSVSPRRDLGVMYTRLMSEIAKYSEDGANILIDKGWMEQPPKAANRDKLAKRED